MAELTNAEAGTQFPPLSKDERLARIDEVSPEDFRGPAYEAARTIVTGLVDGDLPSPGIFFYEEEDEYSIEWYAKTSDGKQILTILSVADDEILLITVGHPDYEAQVVTLPDAETTVTATRERLTL